MHCRKCDCDCEEDDDDDDDDNDDDDDDYVSYVMSKHESVRDHRVMMMTIRCECGCDDMVVVVIVPI